MVLVDSQIGFRKSGQTNLMFCRNLVATFHQAPRNFYFTRRKLLTQTFPFLPSLPPSLYVAVIIAPIVRPFNP